MTLRKIYYYVGWNCKTPSCDAEILCDYLGTKLRKFEFNPPELMFVKCGKCGKTHSYSPEDRPQTFSRSTFVQLRPKPN